MKMSEMFRTLADDLRKEASRASELRREKAAAVLVASTGFGVLSRKLGVSL
jgi:hypothetical protein